MEMPWKPALDCGDLGSDQIEKRLCEQLFDGINIEKMQISAVRHYAISWMMLCRYIMMDILKMPLDLKI